ncbi:MAG TPA: 16S rRNA (guanine(527)-N(7))-methyltransferase RsmG [Actinomycetota bacterium]|nr:16S rRNA (guanine(527)-N(7))-methyltransferase RsmG [Actinomycetota bacterium]
MKREGAPPLTTSPPNPDLLARFEELLRTRAVPLGLISSSDAGRIHERHVLDSLRAVHCLRLTDRTLIDVGAGAGLPGIPVAIVEPERHVVLLEPGAKRAAFLELAVESLQLANVEIRIARAEDVGLKGDVCFARALAPPVRAWELIEGLLSRSGRLVYFAGRSWGRDPEAELEARGVQVTVCDLAQFAWQGPIVMMARTSQ